MIAAFLLVASFAFGYAAVRFFRPCHSRLAELAAAWLIGVFASTWIGFLLSFVVSFGVLAVSLTIALLILGAMVFRRLAPAWEFGIERSAPDAADAVAFLLMVPFFLFGIWQGESGDIYYLGNFTDIPFHLAMVSSFVQQEAFLPDYPQVAGAKLCYHFLINFHTAMVAEGGINLFNALLVDQAALSVCLAFMLAEVLRRLAGGSKKVVLFGVVLFLLAHAGIFNLLAALGGVPVGGNTLSFPDQFHHARYVFLFPFFNFLFPLMNYFMPQRPFLFGFAAFCLVICALLKAEENPSTRRPLLALALVVTAGLPLFHFHSFLLLASTIMLLVTLRRPNMREAAVSYLVLALALPQILFLLSQPMSESARGWDVHAIAALKEVDLFGSFLLARLIFWLRAAGLSFAFGLGGLLYFWWKGSDDRWLDRGTVLWLTVPALFFFLLINAYRMMPSWGDSNKFYLFLHLFFSLYFAMLCSAWWERGMAARAGVVLLILLAGALPSALTYYDFWQPRMTQVLTGKANRAQLMFKAEELACAKWIIDNTPDDAVFLTSDDVIHFLPALTGRRVVDGAYTPTNGLEQPGVKREVPIIYRTGNRELARKWGADYILVSQRELGRYHPNRKVLEENFVLEKPPRLEHCNLFVVNAKFSVPCQ